ncbi:MAG: hypothetical protein ACLFRP_09240 [Puniceicoccaceae bacterium]
MRNRVVQPEILDDLAPDDPAAVANRRDLRFLNRFMGNWRWVARELERFHRPGASVVEAGAGEGDLARYLRGRVPRLARAPYTGIDLWGRPRDWPEGWSWNQSDLLDYTPGPPPDVLVVNLLLHQFEDEVLRELGRRFDPVPVWIICEPLRVRRSVWGLSLLRPFGLHPVSWHDGRVSIRAGFRGNELPDRMGAGSGGREFRVSRDPRGAYRMVSWRKS